MAHNFMETKQWSHHYGYYEIQHNFGSKNDNNYIPVTMA